MELDTQEQTSVLRNLCWKEEERDRVAAGRGGQLKESLKMEEVTAGVCRDRQDPMGGN